MYKNMEEYFLEDPEYVATNAYTELTLRNNIVMRNSRRKEEISKIINYDLAKLTYTERAALIYAYEHKEFISSNSKLHPSTARKALSDLTILELLERHAALPTSPNTYYTLKTQK